MEGMCIIDGSCPLKTYLVASMTSDLEDSEAQQPESAIFTGETEFHKGYWQWTRHATAHEHAAFSEVSYHV